LSYCNLGLLIIEKIYKWSWSQGLAYNFFANNNMCIVWSQLAGIRTPPIVISDFLYIRFIGDSPISSCWNGLARKNVGHTSYRSDTW
jgi:hypothetical protein